MPKAKAGDAMMRQWQMLKLLPGRKPGISAKELTSELADLGFEVDKRTVTRDLAKLSELFPLECNDKGTPHGWHWMRGAGLDMPGLDVADALSLRLIEEYLKPLLPASLLSVLAPRFEAAERKLEQLSRTNTVAGWTDKIRVVPPTMPLLAPAVDEGVLQVIQQALLDEFQIECRYRSIDGRESVQRLHPLALVQRGPVGYLVATAFSYADPRLYALHRFRTAEIIEEPIVRPDGFDVDSYIATGALQFGNGKMLRLKANVGEELAAYLAETPLSEDMAIKERKDDFLVTATVLDSWQLRWWILSQGSEIEVMDPKALRNEIADEVNSLRDVYYK